MPSKATVIASRSTHPCVIPALPFFDAELRAPKPKSEHYPKQINTLGDNICKHRLDLNLRQKQVADQIGVDEATITNWERNVSTRT
jgi:DNA-binding transcriptional regulator YiaG